MAKVNFSSLKLKKNLDVNTFEFCGQTIEVYKYLPIEDKNDIIMISAQQAQQTDGLYNPLILEQRFNLNLIYMYTNLTFTEKQKDDEAKLYDLLAGNGFLDAFFGAMEESEYNLLYENLIEYTETVMEYSNATGYAINKAITDLPEQAKAVKEIVDSFDKDKYQAVVDFAEVANGNRPIN